MLKAERMGWSEACQEIAPETGICAWCCVASNRIHHPKIARIGPVPNMKGLAEKRLPPKVPRRERLAQSTARDSRCPRRTFDRSEYRRGIGPNPAFDHIRARPRRRLFAWV